MPATTRSDYFDPRFDPYPPYQQCGKHMEVFPMGSYCLRCEKDRQQLMAERDAYARGANYCETAPDGTRKYYTEEEHKQLNHKCPEAKKPAKLLASLVEFKKTVHPELYKEIKGLHSDQCIFDEMEKKLKPKLNVNRQNPILVKITATKTARCMDGTSLMPTFSNSGYRISERMAHRMAIDYGRGV